jgi:hypothetical protein
MKRIKTGLSALAISAVFASVAACGGDARDATSSARKAVSSGAISVANSGDWDTFIGCSAWCVKNYNFWIDLSVRNDAYHKEVGILWTRDGWTTVNTAMASYELPLADGRERWGIDVLKVGAYGGPTPVPAVEYAIFVKMNGQTYWGERNHYLRRQVSGDQPVRQIVAGYKHQSDGTVNVQGSVRTLQKTGGKVTIRFTTDGWQTSKDIDAGWAWDNHHTFTLVDVVPRSGSPSDRYKVEFAVRYEIDGQVFWDNNDQKNYRPYLSPME